VFGFWFHYRLAAAIRIKTQKEKAAADLCLPLITYESSGCQQQRDDHEAAGSKRDLTENS